MIITNSAWSDLGTEANARAMQPRGGDVYLSSGASPSEGTAIVIGNNNAASLPGGTRYQIKAVDQAAVNVGVIDFGTA